MRKSELNPCTEINFTACINELQILQNIPTVFCLKPQNIYTTAYKNKYMSFLLMWLQYFYPACILKLLRIFSLFFFNILEEFKEQ